MYYLEHHEVFKSMRDKKEVSFWTHVSFRELGKPLLQFLAVFGEGVQVGEAIEIREMDESEGWGCEEEKFEEM